MKSFSAIICALVATLSFTVEAQLTEPGLMARNGQFPYHVHITVLGGLLGNTKLKQCSGVLINDQVVYTSAQCIKTIDLGNLIINYEVRAGSVVAENPKQIRSARFANTNVRLNKDNYGYDNGLLILSTPFEITTYVKPIKLSTSITKVEDLVGRMLIVTGFGSPPKSGSEITQLFYSTVDIMSRSQCEEAFKHIFSLSFTSFCVKDHENILRTTCANDIGGPAVIMENNEPTLVGLTSLRSATDCNKYPWLLTDLNLVDKVEDARPDPRIGLIGTAGKVVTRLLGIL